MIIYENDYDVGIEALPTPTITLLLEKKADVAIVHYQNTGSVVHSMKARGHWSATLSVYQMVQPPADL